MHRSFRLGPLDTPRPLKILIFTIAGISLLTALFFQIFHSAFLFFLLSLNSYGIKHFFLWQIVTYLFVQPIQYGISFPFLLQLLFNMYLIWIAGTAIYHQKGKKDFFWLYFGSGALSGIIGALILLLSGSPHALAGSLIPIYALLTVWMMLEPELEFFLFFTIPLKSKWLVTGILGIGLFLDLSHSDFLSFFTGLTAILTGYMAALLAYEQHSPFKNIHTFENRILDIKAKVLNRIHGHAPKGKIHPFPSGIHQKQEAFIDQCLEKISKYGKNSLSFWEKIKLWWISKKRKNGRF